MIMAIQEGCSALTCIPLHSGAIPDQQRHSGSSRNFFGVNDATVRGLRHWNFHLLSFRLALSLLCDCDVSYAASNEKFSWELLHCYLTHVTKEW